MHNRQFGTFFMLLFLSLFEHRSTIATTLATSPNTFTERINFVHYLSTCHLQDGRSCSHKNKIICEKNTCKREEVVKLTEPNEFEFKLSKISASQPVNLSCNGADQIVNITDIVYHSPNKISESCFLSNPECLMDFDAANFTNCSLPEPCVSVLADDAQTCKYRHDNVTLKLQSQCLNTNRSCTVSVPRMMINNYDTCVSLDELNAVNCSDAMNYCYAEWAELEYTCITQGMSYSYTLFQCFNCFFRASSNSPSGSGILCPGGAAALV